MKANLFVLIGILILASVAFVGPVAAADTGTAYGYGTLGASVSISLNQSAVYLNLSPLYSPATNNTLGLTISSNKIVFAITVRDNSGRSEDIGFMGNWTPSSYPILENSTNLTQPLGISGFTNGTTTAASNITLLYALGQDLYTGNGKVANQVLGTDFVQAVTMADEPLLAGYQYRIDLEFAITTT